VTRTRVVVDSTGWMEVFTDGRQADHFLVLMADAGSLVVLAITKAIQAAAAMQAGLVVALDSRLALAAAQLSHALQLPMADSIILATARDQQARLNTMDSDFFGMTDVKWLLCFGHQ
jgi:predicted nucleic acid-binding protein